MNKIKENTKNKHRSPNLKGGKHRKVKGGILHQAKNPKGEKTQKEKEKDPSFGLGLELGLGTISGPNPRLHPALGQRLNINPDLDQNIQSNPSLILNSNLILELSQNPTYPVNFQNVLMTKI